MASRLTTSTQDLLGHDKLGEVHGLLRKHNYNETTFFELGIQLGLRHPTLDKIRALHSDTGLIECLNAWIEQVDDVKEHGGPSYYTLIVALRKIKQNRVADEIDQEKHPACAIIACYKDKESILKSIPHLVLLLHKEDLIKAKMIPSNSEAMLMKEVQQSICADYRNLMKFAAVLEMTPATERIAKEITVHAVQKFDILKNDDTESTDKKDILFGGKQLDAIKEMRKLFASTIHNATKAMRKISKKNLRSFLCRGFSQYFLSSELEGKSTDELLDIVAGVCKLSDVSLLEAVADHFKISAAQKVIEEYKKEVDEFCKNTPLTDCLGKEIESPDPRLKCERITFHVSRLANEHQFKDAEDITRYAFEKFNPSVKITFIKDTNSYTITCSFPLVLSESLIASALKNLEILKTKGLLQLTIGHGIVYDVDEKEFDEAAVYARKGILEQLMLSKNIQLINCCQEKEAILAEAEKKKIEYQEKIEMLSKNLFSCQQSGVSISADIATKFYAAMTRHKHIINIEFLPDITHMFRKYHFYGDQYRKFGFFLNISEERLDFIERNFKGDLARCLIECLMAWIRNPDHPSTKTWEKLILAIRHVDEEEIADKIYNEKCKPCEILPDYYMNLYESIEKPFELADILCSKGVIDETSLTKIKASKEEKTYLLEVTQQSICRKKENLKIFAEALQKFDSTVDLGDEILKNIPL